MTVSINTTLSAERVQTAVDAILKTLGNPQTDIQKQALAAFQEGDAGTIKRLALLNLSDNYLKCLGYLVSAPKLTPNTDTILAESARSAAEHTKDVTLVALEEELKKALL